MSLISPVVRAGAEIRWGMWAKRIAKSCGFLAILMLALPSIAQMEIGDAWKMNLSGNIGYNYVGNLNNGISSHNMGFYGDANLSGSFYNPNFLSFNVQPYYDRGQSNAVYGSLTGSKGISANMNLFSGSHMPGSITFSKGIENTNQFGVLGSQVGLAQHGDNTGFGITWSELLPNLPTLTASYAIGDGSSEIFGSTLENSQSNKTLTLMSTYVISGFRLAGGYTHRNVDSSYSQLLDGLPEPIRAISASNNFQFNAQHNLPLSGSFSVGYSRTTYGYDYRDSYNTHSSGGSDTLTSIMAFRPTHKLSLSFGANYNDSLLGAIPEAPINSGTVILTNQGTFRSVLLTADAYYPVFRDLSLHGNVSHINQMFLGQNYSSTQYGGSVNYDVNRRLLGSLSFSLSVFDYATQLGNGALGFVGNMNFNRKFSNWDVSANMSYAQNVQTLLAIYTTSSYGWVANTRRRIGNRTYFGAGYGGTHSGITQQVGSSSSSQRVSGSLTWRTYSVNGYYSKANGEAMLTNTGLVTIPTNLPPGILPADAIMTYDSKAVGGNVSTVFRHRLTLNLGYAEGNGRTVDPALTTEVSTQLYNAIMQYRLRKIYLDGGYTRLRQGVGTPGTVPISVTSYYIGFSRWFNFF